MSIYQTLNDDGVVLDRDIREILVPYLESLIPGTEYEGKMSVTTQNSDTAGENSIVVGVLSETDAMNAYNGTIGYDQDTGTKIFQHERDAKVVLEINMSDNDALWMFSKYVSMNIIQDMARLSGRGIFKIAQHPANEGITVKDTGARKIWTARLAIMVRVRNAATMTAEIC